MALTFSRRMRTARRSFIREILKVTQDPEIISFAGGLPAPELFPVAQMQAAAHAVLSETSGAAALQYSTTEGCPPLRQWIANRYKLKHGLDIPLDDICITTGSQQGLDLIAKAFLDPGDAVIIERPGYLGAIQAFGLYEPRFLTVGLEDDGPALLELERLLDDNRVKMFYAVTSFQNPSGLSYSQDKRKDVAALVEATDCVFVEDNPYGELRFEGQDLPPIVRTHLQGPALLLGTFSKITTPGFRLGWIVAPPEIMDKLIIGKQATDLHSSTLAQRIMHQYLSDNDLDAHVAKIKACYGSRRQVMSRAIEAFFPEGVRATRPEGGMFLWVTLPEGCSAMALFEKAIAQKVAFVPGDPFYVEGANHNEHRRGHREVGQGAKNVIKKEHDKPERSVVMPA